VRLQCGDRRTWIHVSGIIFSIAQCMIDAPFMARSRCPQMRTILPTTATPSPSSAKIDSDQELDFIRLIE
jgi:hypothetical protein